MHCTRGWIAALAAAALLAGCAAPSSRPKAPGVDRVKTTRATARRAPARPAARIAPRSADASPVSAQYRRLLEQLAEGQWSEAEAGLQALTRDHPRYAGPWVNLGILYAKTGRPKEALVHLQRGLDLRGDNVIALTWLGILHRQAGRHAQAEAAYQRALAADADYPLVHLNLGLLYEQHLGRPEAALRHYRRYHALTGGQDLRVAAWIAALEAARGPLTQGAMQQPAGNSGGSAP